MNNSPFNTVEQEAFDAVCTALEKVQTLDKRGRLKWNIDEVVAAIHTLQMFPIMHLIHRTWPDYFSDWYDQNGAEGK